MRSSVWRRDKWVPGMVMSHWSVRPIITARSGMMIKVLPGSQLLSDTRRQGALWSESSCSWSLRGSRTISSIAPKRKISPGRVSFWVMRWPLIKQPWALLLSLRTYFSSSANILACSESTLASSITVDYRWLSLCNITSPSPNKQIGGCPWNEVWALMNSVNPIQLINEEWRLNNNGDL